MSLLTKVIFREQMRWTFWFLAWVLFFYIVLIGVSVYFIEGVEGLGSFLAFTFAPFGTYMLIIGLFSPYRFLTQYAHLGQTRKAYFKSTLLASAMVSVVVAFIALIVTLLQLVLARTISWFPEVQGTMASTLIQSENGHVHIDLTGLGNLAGIDFDDSFVVSLLVFIFLSLMYYLVGWFVGVGYYRFGWIKGFIYVVMGLLLLGGMHWIWGATVITATGNVVLSLLSTILMGVLVAAVIWKHVSKTTIRFY